MKTLLLLFAFIFAACAVSSSVQHYRFAGDNELHSFNVIQNPLGTKWTLYIDGKEIVTGSFGLLSYEDTKMATWNNKKVVLELRYSPGFLGLGSKTIATVFVENEKVAQFEF